ncbi:GntR family transcriptional regulator [Rhizobiales bacterium]|uniref:GntR family transcriptional regulator n=1 Tax=Hongsoonwoonella zoysiae TaxID=2821844 RepID=UPI001560A3AE|nr:GntR family transcriptional regulator [Hongsoonwoonella zoysiae]NRG19103.1 GntR family transcriptional regulator [Hongsoonwoonella zoysiae]
MEQSSTLAERIANQLRRKILLGGLAPGASIKERDNAEELGVSRTPMREAIRILAKEGLVVLRPARSPIVAAPSLKEISDDLEVMSALEVLSGKLACKNATSEELEEIERLYRNMLKTAQTGDSVDLFEVDMDFHRAIAAASHNRSLAQTHAAYLARLWRTRYLSARIKSDRERSLTQHGEIVRGLKARDARFVAKEIGSHIKHVVTNVAGLFEERET